MTKQREGNQGPVTTSMATPATTEETLPGRRKVLEIMGMTAIALPVLGLQACGSDEGSAPAAPSMDKAEPAMADMAKEAEDMAGSAMDSAEEAVDSAKEAATETMQEASDEVEAMADDAAEAVEEAARESATIASDAMAQLDENGPQAAGLGYRHDATTVENARYSAGQQCSNCVLFQGGDSEWGGCPLFTGSQVKATGWCSA
ncbi:high-potential iron-sulfur protein, partial [Congregibacter sp.]|uniref:high-potential iron-sulfur protein n=1 Tax=Congregibacter sp. TaxID=2744308 RepID=UPI00385B9C96